MGVFERVWAAGHEFTGLPPETNSALRFEDWNPLSRNGARVLGEVLLDEMALTGMKLAAPPPKPECSEQACAATADEPAALSTGAHGDPEPLCVKSIRELRFGALRYERLAFEHTPALPRSLAVEGLAEAATAWCICVERATSSGRGWCGCTAQVRGSPLDLVV
ncbi:hypothetical protein A5724_03990 [Mycobacterium sp. ACS1612]|uniref:hypothetical protein n=1 Tax=Mycobacterium sp. ACS1612 TaxID=1834117 RepID=UPI0007FF4B71|nr:hypothetical protein [Mycobacterium sp. ACS1612]OBF25878.1 hypothetical protein A5724_03990 [Mycobacterium sp. ACS1612]